MLHSSRHKLSAIPGRLFELAKNFSPTQVTTLSNGLRVASQHVNSESATVGVWIDAGSRYETADTNGSAHFLEHLAFKGTQRRSRIQLEREIEDMGAHLNAYTSREQTVYFARIFKNDLKQGVDILGDILQNSTLDPRAIESERGVILREMEEIDKTMEEVLLDKLHLAAFRDSSLGYTILGPEENIRSIKREHLKNYIDSNYSADRMVIAAAGPIKHDDLVKHSETHFGQLKSSSLVRPAETKPYWCSSQINHRNDEMGPTAHLCVGYEGVNWRSPDSLTFMIMQQIIGTYNAKNPGVVNPKISGNRTINNIANKMQVGCADSFSAFNTSYKDTGVFGWYAACDEKAVEHCVGEMMFGMTSMAYSVTDEEVQRAKRQLLTTVFASMEDTTTLAEDMGRQLLVYGRRMNPAEFIHRLDMIDAEEVKRVAWRKLHDADITVIGMGPTHGLLQLPENRKHTQWFRY
jgi:mitochondrial-processing peptidase subunit beta